jgi:hypothetical protein
MKRVNSYPSFNLISKMFFEPLLKSMTKPKKKRKQPMKVSVRRASELFQLDRMTLARRLAVAYPEGRPRNQFSLGEIHRALNTPEQQARTRSAKARADILELKVREKAAGLMPVEEFRQGVETFAKVASEVISTLPGAPEDLKRTLLRNIAGIKKANLAAVDQLLKDRARRSAAHLAR